MQFSQRYSERFLIFKIIRYILAIPNLTSPNLLFIFWDDKFGKMYSGNLHLGKTRLAKARSGLRIKKH